MTPLTTLFLIAMAAGSIAWGFFDSTGEVIPALSWGATYFAVRASLDFTARGVTPGRKLAMALLAFLASLIHASMAWTHHPTYVASNVLGATPIEAILSSLAFLCPEVILWAIAEPPYIAGLVYRIPAHRQKLIQLPALRPCFLEIHIGNGMRRIFASDCLEIKILDRACHVVQDLGILNGPGSLSSLRLPAGKYSIGLTNHCPVAVRVRLTIYVRPLERKLPSVNPRQADDLSFLR